MAIAYDTTFFNFDDAGFNIQHDDTEKTAYIHGVVEYVFNEYGDNPHMSNIKEIAFDSGVSAIPYGCLSGATSLRKVHIANKINTIPADAFRDCSSLTSVNIPSACSAIIGGAFAGCSALEKLNIPNTVRVYDESAFDGVPSIKEFSAYYDSYAVETPTVVKTLTA